MPSQDSNLKTLGETILLIWQRSNGGVSEPHVLRQVKNLRRFRLDGRSERIRTFGPYVPNVVLYRAELHSDNLTRARPWFMPDDAAQVNASQQFHPSPTLKLRWTSLFPSMHLNNFIHRDLVAAGVFGDEKAFIGGFIERFAIKILVKTRRRDSHRHGAADHRAGFA